MSEFDALYIYQGFETELYTGEFKKIKILKIPSEDIRDVIVYGDQEPHALIRTLRDGNHRYPIGDIFIDLTLLNLPGFDTSCPGGKRYRSPVSRLV